MDRPTGTNIKDLLGREAAARAATAQRQHGDAQLLDVQLLDPNPFQHRLHIDEDELEDLQESIRTNGLIEPIAARIDPSGSGRFQVIAGHRRHEAFKRLAAAATTPDERVKWGRIPAVVHQDVTDRRMTVLGIIENGDRLDTSPWEQGAALASLQEREGLSFTDLVESLGWKPDRVRRLLRIAKAPEVIRDGCTKGLMVQLYDEEGKPLTTPKGRAKQEHRKLDLMAALEFANLHAYYVREGASARQASAKVEKGITRALADGWSFRRIQEHCRDAKAADGVKGPQTAASGGAGEGTEPSPAPPSFRDDERQLVIYKTRLANASESERASLKAALSAVLISLS
jgi:ParB/RepB/Spo0J family partition protein